MGAVCDEKQDEQDAKELRNLSELMPAFKRYQSHHYRNSISAIILNCESAIEKFNDPDSRGEILNSLHRIKVATEHMLKDMERAGI